MVVVVDLGLVGDDRGRARRWMVGACRRTRDVGISVVRRYGALCVDGGGPICHRVRRVRQEHRVALARFKKRRKREREKKREGTRAQRGGKKKGRRTRALGKKKKKR